jgi:hypothetical protein
MIMAAENPFYLWSIAEAWDWLINLPFLGFAMLVGLVFIVLFAWLIIALLFK